MERQCARSTRPPQQTSAGRRRFGHAVLLAQDSQVASTTIANHSKSCAPRPVSKSVSNLESDLQAGGNPPNPNERQQTLVGDALSRCLFGRRCWQESFAFQLLEFERRF